MSDDVFSRVTERTLYPFIGRVFEKFGWHYFTETSLGKSFPDLMLERDDVKVITEVKIDSETKLIDAIVKAYLKAQKLGKSNAVALLFPNYVRDISFSELERNYPRIEVSAIVLTDWLADRLEVTLEDLAKEFSTSYKDWIQTRKTRVSYDLVVNAARDSIREIAGYLRLSLSQKPVLDSALAVVGRFDIYKSLLEDFSGVSEEDALLYIADIMAYILVNQLLFYHIISEKLGYEKLPNIDPSDPPKDLLDILQQTLRKGRENYPHILGFDLFPFLRRDLRIIKSIARFISGLKALRPQHIREDLFGRLYHETIPPETRKNLGAFYTKPEAARLLAALAIDRWDVKVLDPACGSGTLLVEAYQRKAALAPPMSREELHKMLIDDIWGIDVMHFASHMTSMNLTAQNIESPLKPHVLSQDGIKTMIESSMEKAANDPPKNAEESLTRWLELMTEERIPRDFDVVIMNPPFTRRERIPAKKEDLENLVPEVKGKTGYWAYFMVAADKLLREDGTLAVVVPEEFFVGGGAQSVRKYLMDKNYGIRFIIRSAAEVAFSESTHYRDYLIVLKRSFKGPVTIAILKKQMKMLERQIEKISSKILQFSLSSDYRLESDEYTLIKISDSHKFLRKHIRNLKPLIGFNRVDCQILALELLENLSTKPTLAELEENGICKTRLYRPGQYRIKGVEKYAEKLFVSRYGAKSPNVTFLLDSIYGGKARLVLKGTRTFFEVPLKSSVLSLRTYSGIRHFDISGEEEIAIVDVSALPERILRLTGLIPPENVEKAMRDIKLAYSNFAGKVLIARRIRLTSPNAFWVAFYSSNDVLGSQLPNIQVEEDNLAKLLVLYLNSGIVLLQLLSFAAETEGAWVSLDHERVWSNIHVPEIEKIDERILQKALSVFDKIGKVDAKPLFKRILDHDKFQREIDEIALEMLGLEDWKPRLDEIYNAVADELETMHKILETSRRSKKA